MILFLFIIISTILSIYHPHRSYTPSTVHTFTQLLNHFDPIDDRTFTQRYWKNDTFNKNNIILLSIDGESSGHGISSFIVEYAMELGAGMITVEHRYYGESCPFDKTKLMNEDLRYLSSKQALEDLVYFKRYYMKKNKLMDDEVKWIVIGGSYSGALSAWAKLKYPHEWVGSWSGSAVINTLYEFPQFDQQIPISVGESCANAMKTATLQIEKLVDDKDTRDKTIALFDKDAVKMVDGDFYYMIADMTVLPVQYGHQKQLCDIMTKPTNDLIGNFVDAYKQLFQPIFGGGPDEYSREIMKKTNNDYIRMWWYQKCTDVAYFQIAPTVGSVRSKHVNLEYHLDLCKEVYDIDNVEELIQKTSDYYGGTEILKYTKNTFFSNGSQDPWQRASVTGTGNSDNTVVTVHCQNCGHCVLEYGCPGGCSPSTEYDDGKKILKGLMHDWVK